MAKVENPVSLLVPIHLDALVVNKNVNPLWKDTSMKLSNLDNNKYTYCRGLGYYLEKKATDKPSDGSDDDDDDDIMQTGVHLHWILPDALRKGKLKNDKSTILFPPAPNRWLVVRIGQDYEVRSWIVESDHLNTAEEAKLNWIKDITQEKNGTKTTTLEAIAIGNVVPFADWDEPGEGEINLTVIAPGNPEFAASYMNCRNVFGFYDDMKTDAGRDIKAGTLLTYQVYGWYADSSKTLLDDVKTIGDLPAKLTELGWALKDADKLTEVPGNIIFHAMVQSVVWQAEPASRVPSPGNIDIGIGNSTSEALAALLRKKVVTSESTIPNKLLAAYQFKSLQDKGLEGNGLDLLKKQMHARSFSPVDGGTYFDILPKEKNGDKIQTDKDTTNLPFPVQVSDCLIALNIMQREYDDKFNELTSLQAALYALKFKKAFSLSAERGTGGIPEDELNNIQAKIDADTIAARGRIKALITNLDAARKEIKPELNATGNEVTPKPAKWPQDYRGLIVDKYNELLKLMNAGKMKDYVVAVDVPMPKYFEPSDPSVAISGLNPPQKYYKKGVSTLKSYLGDADDTSLKCRVNNQTADQIRVKDSTTTAMKVASLVDIDDFIDDLTDKAPGGVAEVFTEAILLNILMADEICSAMQYDIKDINDVKDVINFFRKNAVNFTRFDKTGPAYLPADFAVSNWEQPWNPLYLEWLATWESSYDSLNPNVLSAWKFGGKDSAVDYTYDVALMGKANERIQYSGRTLLSLQSANKVQELNEKIITHFNTKLFEGFIPMTQTLGGFSTQLIQRGHTVQLPILNQVNDQLVIDDDYKLIGDQNTWSPMVVGKPFYPLRMGKLKIDKLRMIDAFGQVLEQPINDRSFKAEAGVKAPLFASSAALHAVNDDYTFALSPRIVQPARLLFNWKSANHANRVTDSDPATNPVCGWLLYNQLDKNISVFDTAGKEIGIIIEDTGTKKINYILPPGGDSLTINNEILNNVVKFIIKSEQNFNSIKNQIAAVIKKIQAKQSRQEITMSLPTGFPMAVVAAQFLVELKELRASDQSWRGGAADKKLDPINFSLSIGNSANKTDGLTGYFIKNNYNDFILPSGEEQAITVFTKTPKIKFVTGTLEHLTLIMDPRTTVSISSGILPMGNYELPQQQVTRALKNINLRILAAPFITPKNKIKVPLLQANDISWDFINPKTGTVSLNASLGTSQIAFDGVQAAEGWLRITTSKPEDK